MNCYVLNYSKLVKSNNKFAFLYSSYSFSVSVISCCLRGHFFLHSTRRNLLNIKVIVIRKIIGIREETNTD